MPRGGIRKTHSQFQSEFIEKANGDYTLLSTYIDSKTKIEVLHNSCGYRYEVTPTHFLNGTRCPECRGTRRKTHEEYETELYNVFGNEYQLVSKYTNAKTKVTLKHNICGYTYEVAPFSALKGHRCHQCFGTKKYTHEEFIQKIHELVGNEYTVLSSYNNWDSKVLFKHNICGYEYEASGGKFLHGRRCPNCAGNVQKTTQQFVEQIKQLIGTEYEVISDYITAKEKISMRHKACDNTFEVTPDNFLRGRRCRYCTNMSESEKEIYDFLKMNNIEFEIEYSFEDLINIAYLRFDFMIRINSKEFFLLEYDGKQHYVRWGDESSLNSLQERDKMKDKYCEEKGYKLVRIPYWESSLDRIEEELKKYGVIAKRHSKQLSFEL